MAGADTAGQGAREPHFDIVIRGYNTRQVNERVTRLEFDLKNCTRDRDGAVAMAAELSQRLTATQSELTRSKDNNTRLANTPLTGTNVTDRVRMMMSLAQEEITELRDAAAEQAEAVKTEAIRYAAEQRANLERVAAEQQEYRRHLEAQHQQLVSRLNSEHQSLTADLAERGTRLQEKYSKHQDALDQEYEGLRATLAKEHKQLMSQARAEADRINRQAVELASKTMRDAEESARRRTAEADARVAELRGLQETLRSRIVDAKSVAEQALNGLTAHSER